MFCWFHVQNLPQLPVLWWKMWRFWHQSLFLPWKILKMACRGTKKLGAWISTLSGCQGREDLETQQGKKPVFSHATGRVGSRENNLLERSGEWRSWRECLQGREPEVPVASWPRLYLNSCLTCLTQVLPALGQTATAALQAWVLQCLTAVPHAQPKGARESYTAKLCHTVASCWCFPMTLLTPASPDFIISPSDRNLFAWRHQDDYSLCYNPWRKDVLEQCLPLLCLLCMPAAYSVETDKPIITVLSPRSPNRKVCM